MNDPQPISPRRRLQILLAIPDSQRTEAQWDEIVELEIQLAPGNRQDTPSRLQPPSPSNHPRRDAPPGPGAKGQGHKPQFRGRGKPPKKNPPNPQ